MLDEMSHMFGISSTYLCAFYQTLLAIVFSTKKQLMKKEHYVYTPNYRNIIVYSQNLQF